MSRRDPGEDERDLHHRDPRSSRLRGSDVQVFTMLVRVSRHTMLLIEHYYMSGAHGDCTLKQCYMGIECAL